MEVKNLYNGSVLKRDWMTAQSITRYKQSKWNVQSLNKKGVNLEPNPPAWFSSRVVETAAQAEATVAADEHDGYVAIKVYSLLSPEACAATQSPALP